MRLSEIIKTLQQIQVNHSSHSSDDPEVELIQNNEIEVVEADMPGNTARYIAYSQFFIAYEEYEDGWKINLRTWPY